MTTDADLIRARFRLIAEPLTTNPTLREALDDDQAQTLLDWGMAMLQQAAKASVDMPDKQAETWLDDKATAVGLAMQLVNELVAHPDPMPDEDIVNSRLIRLGKNLYWLTESGNRKQQKQGVAKFEKARHKADSDTAFALLMDIIHAYDS